MPNDKNETRDNFPHFLTIPTRWIDNDIYGHMNNALYHVYFDTVVGDYLMKVGGLHPHEDQVVGFVVENHCQFYKGIQFPDVVEAGLRVAKLGNSSVRYEIGLFRQGDLDVAAVGYFVHVFVNRQDQRPTPIPDSIRAALNKLLIENL